MKILGSGYYLPKRKILAEEIDVLAGLTKGDTLKRTGIKSRYYADYTNTETNSIMGKYAAEIAIKNSGLNKEEIDLIIGASATKEVLLPSSAPLIQKELGLEKNRTACFDVDSTCISFLAALDVADSLLKTKKYKNILIVSSEVASVGLDYESVENAGLFGDGAAAFVLTDSDDELKAKFQTYSEGKDYTEIKNGGTKFPARLYNESNKKDYLFQMNGRKSFKLIKQNIGQFFNEFIAENGIDKSKLTKVVPHQASVSGLKLIIKYLDLDMDKTINLISEYGNMIAASIPFTFAHAIENKMIERGDKILMLGTSAGLSIGMIVLDY